MTCNIMYTIIKMLYFEKGAEIQIWVGYNILIVKLIIIG